MIKINLKYCQPMFRSIGLYTRVNHMQSSLEKNKIHLVSSSTKIIDCRFLHR